jgi:hypothetical protein
MIGTGSTTGDLIITNLNRLISTLCKMRLDDWLDGEGSSWDQSAAHTSSGESDRIEIDEGLGSLHRQSVKQMPLNNELQYNASQRSLQVSPIALLKLSNLN